MNKIEKNRIIVKQSIKEGLFEISKMWIRLFGVKDTFYFKEGGRNKKLFLAYHNCGTNTEERISERGVELSIAQWWIEKVNNEFVEVGAVTPYYKKLYKKHDVIDPYDSHKEVSEKKSLFDIDFAGKNVLTISTLEHVGTGDYNLSTKENCVNAIKKILHESKKCLITFPMGYNTRLDEYVKKNSAKYSNVSMTIYKRGLLDNNWKICKCIKQEFYYGPLGANAICVLMKL